MGFPITSISLTQNIITAALFNMIISQNVFDSKVASSDIADIFRVDGTLYGDTKIFHSFDIGALEDWLNDEEAQDLLKLNRNKSGKTQTITMGVYKIISITIDNYLSKQAFTGEGTFSEYTSFLTGSLRKIKKVYDRSIIASTLGTLTPATKACDINIVTPQGSTIEETNRLEAQTIAKELVILKANVEDNNRKYNALDYLRSYNISDFVAFWNVEKKANITKMDLPSLFHNDLNEGGGFTEKVLPSKWFGKKASATLTLKTSAPTSEVTQKILISGWYKVDATNVTLVQKPDGNKTVFLWAGDDVPYTGQVYKDYARDIEITVVSTKLAKEYYYVLDHDIAFMLVHKSSLPYMSGFNVGTEFFNGRSLTSTKFLIFGHNNLEFIEEYPRFRVKITKAQPTG